MSPLNRGPLMGPRMGPPIGMRPPPPRFARPPMPGLPPRMMGMPPPLPMPMGGPIYNGPPVRQRMGPPRPGSMMRPNGPPPLLRPRNGLPPLMPQMMGPRGMGPRGPLMRPGPRGMLPPPPGPLHMRPRFTSTNGNNKNKHISNSKKANKFEEIELKKPWMTDEIRSEIQKKNKLYAKAKKNKDAKEWDEFKDLRNKVTRMIRDAKNDYLIKNPDQAALYQDEEDFTDPRDEKDNSNDEMEENEEVYYCDPCDRDFISAKLLEQHLNEHRVCGIDNCTFTAHSKVVELHIKNQHITGHYDRIKKAEDIPDWIAERKRQFPTKKNIELKNAANLEKQERGEIIQGQNKRKSMTPRDENNSRQPREKKRKRAKKRRPEIQKPITNLENVESCQGILPFRGTKCDKKLIETDDEETHPIDDKISDDDDDEQPTLPRDSSSQHEETPSTSIIVQNDTPSASNSLLGLVADYGSDTDDEPPDETPIKKVKLNLPEFIEDNSSTTIQSSNQVPVKLTEKTNENLELTSNNNNKNKQQQNTIDKKPKKPTLQMEKKYPTLLEKLLEKEIHHERNYIAQIIKYIYDNNFFDEINDNKCI
ncbi:nuclear fragile X mental retardation-interacting protein 1-like isoform X2 [Aphidius gifuensis]|uniref:nuclear fragile X mental retardation-interacting protein 1-like isoform X2 n=1 Tax=Aphidius gifuensis TaxID=684658 RepID=UPI001CDCCF50|nr:nuclear fragile X mental retardation-interacting protein 1-like isoform X2 [Aphidius gifuensis]